MPAAPWLAGTHRQADEQVGQAVPRKRQLPVVPEGAQQVEGVGDREESHHDDLAGGGGGGGGGARWTEDVHMDGFEE